MGVLRPCKGCGNLFLAPTTESAVLQLRVAQSYPYVDGQGTVRGIESGGLGCFKVGFGPLSVSLKSYPSRVTIKVHLFSPLGHDQWTGEAPTKNGCSPCEGLGKV